MLRAAQVGTRKFASPHLLRAIVLREKSHKPENVQNRTAPFSPVGKNESEHMRYHRENIWKAEKEKIILDHDSFLGGRFKNEVNDFITSAEEIERLTPRNPEEPSFEDVRGRIERQLDHIKVPTVAEDFNQRQSGQGNYGGSEFAEVREILNRSERQSSKRGIPTRQPVTPEEGKLLS
jgi:hypothetical protein